MMNRPLSTSSGSHSPSSEPSPAASSSSSSHSSFSHNPAGERIADRGATFARKRPGPRPSVCLACHSAKIKCDRKSPCSHCVRRGVNCVFDDGNRSVQKAKATGPSKTSIKASRKQQHRERPSLAKRSAAERTAEWHPASTDVSFLPDVVAVQENDTSIALDPDRMSHGLSSATWPSSQHSAHWHLVPSDTSSIVGLASAHPDSRTHGLRQKSLSPHQDSLLAWTERKSEDDDDERIETRLRPFEQQRRIASEPVSVFASPSTEYARSTWLDNLLSFFGADPYTSRKRVQTLLHHANRYINEMHRFELASPFFISSAMKRPDRLNAIDSAMVFALAAVGLRVEAQRTMAIQSSSTFSGASASSDWPTMWKILPRNAIASTAVSVQQSFDDLSMQLQHAAEVYLMQVLASSSAESIEVLLRVAQTSAYLLTLQPLLSDRYLHFHQLIMKIARSDVVNQCLRTDNVPVRSTANGKPLVGHSDLVAQRNSLIREEAVRLKLFPFWSIIPMGCIYPNVEFPMLEWIGSDLDDVAVYLGWPAEESNPSNKMEVVERVDAEVAFLQVQAFQIVANTFYAWKLPETVDYIRPTTAFAKALADVEFSEDLLVQLQAKYSTGVYMKSVKLQRYLARYSIATCSLNGLVIRRLGFLHNRHLRPAVVAALEMMQAGGDPEACANAATMAMRRGTDRPAIAAWQEPLNSPGLSAWIKLIERMTHDLGEGTPGQSPVLPNTQQFDSLVLYVAATSQYSHGVRQLYTILGHPMPQEIPLAIQLDKAAQRLQQRVESYRRQSTQTRDDGEHDSSLSFVSPSSTEPAFSEPVYSG